MHTSSKSIIPILLSTLVISLSLACGGTSTVSPTLPAATQLSQKSPLWLNLNRQILLNKPIF